MNTACSDNTWDSSKGLNGHTVEFLALNYSAKIVLQNCSNPC